MFKILQIIYIITLFISKVFPAVKYELAVWRKKAQLAEPVLRAQALASIKAKTFHCLGGSIYSLYRGSYSMNCTRFIVALQTMSDYLDNLCDRTGFTDEAAFRQLHLAMTDALTPYKSYEDYYLYYPYKDDGGYLAALVETCQNQIAKLPAYSVIQKDILALADLYCELQTYKHLALSLREEKIKLWINKLLPLYPQLTTWEVVAATGSTLGIFVLCAAAASSKLTPQAASRITEAYFPYICSLHILLDYYIDEAEDKISGDLNFITYYESREKVPERLLFILHQSLLCTQKLPKSSFHYTILCGLLAMYLSDDKACVPEKKSGTIQILRSAGLTPNLLYRLCKLLRKKQII